MPRSRHVSVYTGSDRQQRESYGRVWPTGLRGQSHPDTSYLGYRDSDYADEARPRDEAAWNRYRRQEDFESSGFSRPFRGGRTYRDDDRRNRSRLSWEQARSRTPRHRMPAHQYYNDQAPDYDLIRFMGFRESERRGHEVPGTRTLDLTNRRNDQSRYTISDRDAENREVGHFYRTPGCDWREVNHYATWGWR